MPIRNHAKTSPGQRGPRWGAYAAGIVFAGCLLLLSHHAFCSNAAMKGPAAPAHKHIGDREPETSSVRLVFLGAIELFQKRISPIDGSRCGFSPTCSTFGHQAVREHGPVRGVMMTADRLMRCTIFKKAGPDYTLLPNGILSDPTSRNILKE